MTSMPASRRARAMILAPRSCPSKPGLATTTRILPLDAASTAGRDPTPQPAADDVPPVVRLRDLDDGLHRRGMHLADDLEGAALAEPVAVGLALPRNRVPGGEARALHVVGLAVGPDPLDRPALPDLHRFVGGHMPGDVGGGERLGGGDGGHEGCDREES